MPETVTLHVLMHCEGCMKTVKRACARIPRVATYRVDYPAQKVTVTGDVTRDEVLKRILKTGKHAELLVPLEEPKKDNKTMGEEKQTVILKVVLHCEGCARTVKRAVKRIPGVTDYNVDFPGQKVTVTGAVTPEDVYRHVSRTGKITVLVPPPPPPPPPPEPEAPKAEEAPKVKPPKEESKAEEAKPTEEPKEEAPPTEEKKPEEPKAEEPKAEESKKEEEPKKEEAAPAAEEKKPEEAKPEEKNEEAPAAAAEEKKPEEKPAPAEEKPAPAEEKPAPPPPPTWEELYPVTFVLGPDYTRYYYY